MSVLLIAGALGYLAFGNFGENIVYFVTPSEVKAFTPEAYAKKVRVGGMVVEGRRQHHPGCLPRHSSGPVQRGPGSSRRGAMERRKNLSFNHDYGQTFRRLHAY